MRSEVNGETVRLITRPMFVLTGFHSSIGRAGTGQKEEYAHNDDIGGVVRSYQC